MNNINNIRELKGNEQILDVVFCEFLNNNNGLCEVGVKSDVSERSEDNRKNVLRGNIDMKIEEVLDGNKENFEEKTDCGETENFKKIKPCRGRKDYEENCGKITDLEEIKDCENIQCREEEKKDCTREKPVKEKTCSEAKPAIEKKCEKEYTNKEKSKEWRECTNREEIANEKTKITQNIEKIVEKQQKVRNNILTEKLNGFSCLNTKANVFTQEIINFQNITVAKEIVMDNSINIKQNYNHAVEKKCLKNEEEMKAEESLFEKIKMVKPPSVNASLVLLYAILSTMFIVGWIYLNSCSLNKLIPIYLIVAGTTGIVIKILLATKNKYLFNLLLAFVLFDVIWHGFGSYWVYKEFQPNYDKNKGESYCNRLVYLLAFWVITLKYSLFGLFLLLSGCYLLMRGSFMKI